MKEPL